MTRLGALVTACRVEGVKLRRSLIPALTAGGGALAALMSGGFMLVLRAPGAEPNAVLGKAQMFGATSDLPGYLTLLLTVYAAGGPALCGIVAAWTFGREFSDRTFVDLLALPTPRSSIVVAKFMIVVVWCAMLTAVVFVAGLIVAGALDLSGWSVSALAAAAGRLALMYALGVVLMTPVGFVASAGRGYLPGIGIVLLVVVLAQSLATLGIGRWFPWAVPALVTGVGGHEAQAQIGAGSYLLVGLTAAAGAGLTLAWWQFADHR